MIKYGMGVASGVTLALAAVAWPGSASMASPVHVTRSAHRAAQAAAGSAPVAWVVNQSVHRATKGSVTPIGTATNTVIKNIPVPFNATGVALAPDGKIAYVAVFDARAFHGLVIPVNTTTYQKGKPVRAGDDPGSMAVTPNGRTLYVADALIGRVTPINTATGTTGKPINTGANPFAVAVAITPNSKTAYVANEEPDGTVTPINTTTNTAGKNIKTGSEPLAIAITPNGKTAYVLNLGQGVPGKGSVTPINTATNTAGKNIPLKDAAFPDATNLMVMTPNGKTLYAADNTTLTPVDTATNTTLPAIRVAPRHGSDFGAAITPDGSTVYVEGAFDKSTRGFIVPVCTTTGAVGKAIVFRGFPSRMAITPNGKTLYVLRAGAPEAGLPQDVIPINTAANTAGKPIETGLQPTAITITTGRQQR